ncbi:MAG: hypothetical protein HC923_13015 [Myxococcales bacterium]|nr:hypothetical protein [Myxococcales bacterium]
MLATERDGRRELLELTEVPLASSSWGRRFAEPANRIEQAIRHLWRGRQPLHLRIVRSGGAEKIVRSRLGRATLDVRKLAHDQQDLVLMAQVSILGHAHRGAYTPDEAPGLAAWLEEAAEVIHQRYAEVYARMFGS